MQVAEHCTCYRCGQVGHITKDCSLKQQDGAKRQGRTNATKIAPNDLYSKVHMMGKYLGVVVNYLASSIPGNGGNGGLGNGHPGNH